MSGADVSQGSDDERRAVYRKFHEAVNMSPRQLERWLDTTESRSVGVTSGGGRKQRPGGDEAIGHRSGRDIVRLLRTKQADLSDDDYAVMRNVVGYVRRHLAQRPTKQPLETSRWRYSLMNWGHDPLADG